MRTEDEDPPTHTFVIYHLYDGSQPEGWYSTPNEVAKGIVECFRREYCGVRGANVEEVGATDIEETKLQTPVLRIYEVSVVPCP